MTPGTTEGIRNDSTTGIINDLVSHSEFEKVVEIVDSAIDLATTLNSWWKAETRDALVRDIAGKIPELNGGYYLKHMVRSLASVLQLDDTPCRSTYYKMSGHNNAATTLLEKAKVKPIDILLELATRGRSSSSCS